MGGAFTGFSGSGMNKCDGKDVLKELNDAFGDYTSDRYKYAVQNNFFDKVLDAPGNYRTLISAYVEAGVDVCARWGAYLRKLGADAEGQNDIYEIAQTRYKALIKGDVPMQTTSHDPGDMPHGGKRVKKHQGSGPKDAATIDSPYS
jgi:hypothetical protein